MWSTHSEESDVCVCVCVCTFCVCVCARVQSDPEFVQWKKELTEAFTEAQKLLRRAPKVIGKGRAGMVELSKPPLTHRNSNGL